MARVRRVGEVHIVGLGSCTAVGLTPLAIAAAVRAGIAPFEEHDLLLGADGRSIVVAQVPGLPRATASLDRMQQLARQAASEALLPLEERFPGKIPVMVALPSPRPGLTAEHLEELRVKLRTLAPTNSLSVLIGGHATGLIALAQGCEAIRAGAAEFCLVGAVDSYLGCKDYSVTRPAALVDGQPNPDAASLETLEWLSIGGKLHSRETPWGFIPGEGAGFCLLASTQAIDRHELRSLGRVLSVALSREEKLPDTAEVCLGEGLSVAFQQVLASLPAGSKIDQLFCDLNGEPYRVDELGFTLTRTAAHFADLKALSAPAACWGDVGVASGPLCVNLAVASWASGFHGPLALCYSGSNSGERAVAVISCAAATTMVVEGAAHVEQVISQHAEVSAALFQTRGALLEAPHVALRDLHRHDMRLDAHVQGLRAAGERGWRVCESRLDMPDTGSLAVAMLLAAEERHPRKIDRMLALAAAVPDLQAGVISAFCWISARFLQGTVREFLASHSPLRRLVGIDCCAAHGVDPGAHLVAAIDADDPALRSRALRAAGELGRRDLLAGCEAHLEDPDSSCRCNAAWAGVLLGDRGRSLDVLLTFLATEGPVGREALDLGLKVIPPDEAYEVLKSLAAGADSRRTLIRGVGVAGDPYYIPWLIKQTQTLELARSAGESLSLITGVDLASLELQRAAPEDFQSVGPSDEPADERVAPEEDDALPWPDPDKLEAWWSSNASRFQVGTRYFMGSVVGVAQCRKVLLEGFQRQRRAAALHLALLQPGMPLFEWRAPAWRQQRLLANGLDGKMNGNVTAFATRGVDLE